MKIFTQIVATKWEDWHNLNRADMDAYFEKNRLDNEMQSRDMGYTGSLTGKLVRIGVADGYATYMVLESATRAEGRAAIRLMHMDWVGGYQFQYAHRWTKKDVKDMIRREESMAKLFG